MTITPSDINFDYRKDSKCGDPDTDSPKLYHAHQQLWNKPLPSGESFNIIKERSSGRLLLNGELDNYSSDRLCPHFVGAYNGKFDGWISEHEAEKIKEKVRTIGGHIIFPAHKKNGFTVNQARGVNRKIGDRFDLTLECIRLFYSNQKSPLFDCLIRYSDFFKMFDSFKGYTDFFLLQDFLESNGQVKFSIPFDNFQRNPLPNNSNEYEVYAKNTIEQIELRNQRILMEISQHTTLNKVNA